MQKISLVTITNNIDICRKYLFNNINSFDENIIVITNEDSILPPNHKTKIFRYKWDDNFSNAINFGISKCTCDWILRLDSDEYIDKTHIEKVYNAIANKDNDYYLVNIFSFHEDPLTIKSPDMRNGFLSRIFKNNKNVKYENIIHEQNYISIQNEHLRGGLISDFGIYHFGEIGCSSGKWAYKEKKKYYQELIEKQTELTPKDARYYEFIGNHHYHFCEYEQALEYIQKASETCHPEKMIYYLSKRAELLRLIKENNTANNLIQLEDRKMCTEKKAVICNHASV